MIASIANRGCSSILIINVREYLCEIFGIRGHAKAVSFRFRASYAEA